jgi:hypothetical protein
MEENLWTILEKELPFYGITLINQEECAIVYNGKNGRLPINKVLISLKNRMKNNGELFEKTWKELLQILDGHPKTQKKEALDELLINSFINVSKDLYIFAEFITSNFSFIDKSLKFAICPKLKVLLETDYALFFKETILYIISYKIILDWIFKKMELLAYITSLLKLAKKGPRKLSNIKIKTARGISGPWANLDLPTLERVFPWEDIAEEMEGRRSDIRKQHRYRKGFEHYNDPYGRVGEGHYFREIRNEPFSWSNRGTDSPYPSRNMLSKWGSASKTTMTKDIQCYTINKNM